MMKKTPLITLATAAAIAGIGATTKTNQVAAATSGTTATVADPAVRAEKNVNVAQNQVNQAKTQANQTQQAKQTAAQALTDAQQASQQAQTDSDQALETQKQATPEAIQQAQGAVDDAKATQSDAQQGVDAAESAVANAQTAVDQVANTQEKADAAVDNAQTAVDHAQAQVEAHSPAATQAAQQTVTEAQKLVDTDTKANTQAQQASTKADTAVATAQQNVTQAQATVDKTTATVTAQQGTGGLQMPAGYLDAYHHMPKYSDDMTDDQYNEILANDKLAQLKKQVTMLGYTPTAADKAENIADMTNLTQAQVRELSEFSASVLNDIRQQMGISALHVTDGSVISASLVTKADGDARTYQFYGNPSGYDIDAEFSQKIAKAAGISIGRSYSYEDEDGKTVVEVYGDGHMEDIGSEWGWNFSDGDKSSTMGGLKAGVVAYLGMMLDGTNYATHDGEVSAIGPWRDEADRHFDGTPDMVADLLLGESSQDGPFDYLGATIDHKGQLRFILQSMTGVSKSEAYFNNTTTPAPIAHPTDTKAASQLVSQQAVLTKAKKALTDAQVAQTQATTTKTKTAQALTASQSALKQAQKALVVAQSQVADTAALTQAKQDLAEAQTQLATVQKQAAQAQTQVDAAHQVLDAKQADLTTAKDQLEAAQAVVAQAQTRLDTLKNADANVQATQVALILAQREVIAAQLMYDDALAPDQAAQTKLAKAQAKLKVAQAQLTTIKQQQARAKALTHQVSPSHETVALNAESKVSAIQTQAAKVAALPQAGETNQSHLLGLTGAALLSLIGFGAYSLKKRV